MNVIKRHRGEINNCAAEARKLGGNRVTRAKRMKRCICPTARGWRFAPGKPMTVEEKAAKGTAILSLKTRVFVDGLRNAEWSLRSERSAPPIG